jgi:hypothetical protein
MDAGVLRDRIQATLDPNAAIRQQAELDLKHVRGWRALRRGILTNGRLGRRAARLHRRPAEPPRAGAGSRHPVVEYGLA